MGCGVFILADLLHIEHLVLVGFRSDGVAVKRLEAFGIGDGGRQATRDVGGDMIATDLLLAEELSTHTGHAPALAATLGAGFVVVTGMMLKRRGGQSAQ